MLQGLRGHLSPACNYQGRFLGGIDLYSKFTPNAHMSLTPAVPQHSLKIILLVRSEFHLPFCLGNSILPPLSSHSSQPPYSQQSNPSLQKNLYSSFCVPIRIT